MLWLDTKHESSWLNRTPRIWLKYINLDVCLLKWKQWHAFFMMRQVYPYSHFTRNFTTFSSDMSPSGLGMGLVYSSVTMLQPTEWYSKQGIDEHRNQVSPVSKLIYQVWTPEHLKGAVVRSDVSPTNPCNCNPCKCWFVATGWLCRPSVNSSQFYQLCTEVGLLICPQSPCIPLGGWVVVQPAAWHSVWTLLPLLSASSSSLQ